MITSLAYIKLKRKDKKKKALVLTSSGTHHNIIIHVAFLVGGNMVKTLNHTGLSGTLPNIMGGARTRSFHIT
jgi:hypothetical protein